MLPRTKYSIIFVLALVLFLPQISFAAAWNTFLGGTDFDTGYAVVTDIDGNIYAAGNCLNCYWIDGGPFHSGYGVFAVKVSPEGNLLWHKFIGGTGTDSVGGMTVDASGNIYVVGQSTASWGSPKRSFVGISGVNDAFVVKLDNSGNILWNTFLGSSVADYGRGVAVDSSGNVYVTGDSSATWGSPLRAYSSGTDAWVAKLTSAGVLSWNIFLGGSSSDSGYAVSVDADDNVFVGGYSGVNWGSPIVANLGYDAFVAKLTSEGVLSWHTFVGSSLGSEAAYSMMNDPDGNIYFSGSGSYTWGSPVCAHAGGVDALVAKLDSSGALMWHTFLGSADEEIARSISLGSDDNIYIAGYGANTWGTPLSPYGGNGDGFAAKLNNSGALINNTFFGAKISNTGLGKHANGGTIDQSNNIYLIGSSDETWGSPIRAFTTSPSGAPDAFISRVSLASPSSAKAITSFTLSTSTLSFNGVIDEDAKTVTFTVPFGTNINGLAQSVTITGVSINPATTTLQDFVDGVPITYTVTAADSSTQEYAVTVNVGLSPFKAITAFTLSTSTLSFNGVIDEDAKTVTFTVPFGTNINGLAQSVTITGVSINPATTTLQDFVDGVPVIYTVTAADSSTQEYAVTVNVALSPFKAITAFTLSTSTLSFNGVIDEGLKTVTFTVPFGTNINGLAQSVTITGVSINPATTTLQDFVDGIPVTYTVTAADSSTQEYAVTVNVAPSSTDHLKSIVSFNLSFPSSVGLVDEDAKTVTLIVPFGSSLIGLVPTIVITGSSISPESGVAQTFVGGVPVIYTVTAADSSTQEYAVTVNVAPYSDTTPPVITKIGGDMDIYVGTTYTDPGATALDNVDGAVLVTTTGTVNTSVAGTYTITYSATDASSNTASTTRSVSVLAVPASTQVIAENTTVNTSAPEVVVGANNSATSTITVPSTVTNATINLSAVTSTTTSNTTAVVPGAININATTASLSVTVTIPAGVQITAATPSWNGTMNVPQVRANSTVTVTPDSGNTATVSSVVEIGYGDTPLTFDKAVRINLVGQGGKYVGYSRGSTFTAITTTCSADTQTAGDALSPGGNCKITIGSDLIIWTKHFTSFVTYTQTAIPVSSGGGGGGGGGTLPAPPTYESQAVSSLNAAVTTIASSMGVSVTDINADISIPGASTAFVFTSDLYYGTSNSAVTALQTRLTQEGVYSGPITGYYGNLTVQAVRRYQERNSISTTGNLGPITRASLNSVTRQDVSTEPTLSTEPASTPSVFFSGNMGIGSRGNEITELQTRLTQEGVYSGPITGYYGNLTSEAVKRYQERHGISNTGYVGPITRERLNKGATVFVPPPQPLPQAKTPSETAQLQQYLELLKQLADLTEKAILLR